MKSQAGFEKYISLEQNVTVLAHRIEDYEMHVVSEFWFASSNFSAGDYIIIWDDGSKKGRTSIITPEIFALKYRKVEETDAKPGPAQDIPVIGAEDANSLRAMTNPNEFYLPSRIQYLEKQDEIRVRWDSPDEARAFIQEFQYVVDHQDEALDDEKLSDEELAHARLYIQKAREYLAAVNEPE